MVKRFLVLFLGVSLLSIGLIWSQEPPQQLKDKILKSQVAVIRGPNLVPSLWVNCCSNGCEKVLENKGFMLVNDITIYIHNSGDRDSTSTTGKVEFFDVFTNSNRIFNFSVGAVPAKGWASNINPRKITGPFLVAKDKGITVIVTFKDMRGHPKTNTQKETACSELY